MRSYLVRSSPARWVAEVEERRHLRSSALKALAAYSDRSTINLNCGTMPSTSTHIPSPLRGPQTVCNFCPNYSNTDYLPLKAEDIFRQVQLWNDLAIFRYIKVSKLIFRSDWYPVILISDLVSRLWFRLTLSVFTMRTTGANFKAV